MESPLPGLKLHLESHRVLLVGALILGHFNISDLPEVVLPGNTIALHADDCKCSRIIDAADDQDLFQED